MSKTIQQIRNSKLSKELELLILETRKSIQEKIEKEFINKDIDYPHIDFLGLQKIING